MGTRGREKERKGKKGARGKKKKAQTIFRFILISLRLISYQLSYLKWFLPAIGLYKSGRKGGKKNEKDCVSGS